MDPSRSWNILVWLPTDSTYHLKQKFILFSTYPYLDLPMGTLLLYPSLIQCIKIFHSPQKLYLNSAKKAHSHKCWSNGKNQQILKLPGSLLMNCVFVFQHFVLTTQLHHRSRTSSLQRRRQLIQAQATTVQLESNTGPRGRSENPPDSWNEKRKHVQRKKSRVEPVFPVFMSSSCLIGHVGACIRSLTISRIQLRS